MSKPVPTMTGPQHYRAAEEALAIANSGGQTPESETAHLAEAQVYATLAQVAAAAA